LHTDNDRRKFLNGFIFNVAHNTRIIEMSLYFVTPFHMKRQLLLYN
jgi:hypothetical protein